MRSGWGWNVKFRNPSATVEILGRLLQDPDVDGLDKSYGRKMFSDLDLLVVVIRACLERAAKVGNFVLLGFVDAAFAT